MNWKDSINDFKDYLRIERGLSNNSVLSYENDLKKLSTFLNSKGEEIKPVDVNSDLIKEFIYNVSKEIKSLGMVFAFQAVWVRLVCES